MDIVDILYTEIHHSLRVITYIASHVSHLYSDGLSQEQKSDSTTRKSYSKGKYFNFHTWYISFLSIHCWILFWNSIQKSIKQQSRMSEYPCGICKVEVQKNDAAILCKLCNRWNHINCVQVNLMTYEKLKSNPTLWHCPLCINELMFANTSKSEDNSTQATSGYIKCKYWMCWKVRMVKTTVFFTCEQLYGALTQLNFIILILICF